MKKLFVSLLAALLLALPAAAGAVELPWKTFSGDMTEDVVSVDFANCGGGTEVLVVLLARDRAGYMFVYDPKSGNIVFVFYPDKTGASEYGLGRVDLETPGAHDLVPPLKWYPADSSLGNLCDHVVRLDA